jgi:hypothetical protein
MRSPRYILLKCVPCGAMPTAKVTRKLKLAELEALALASYPTVHWGLSPRGPLPVKNPDGSVVMIPPHRGFSFSSTPSIDDFYICYEFYDGICIHTERDNRACEIVTECAISLEATVFPID